MIEIPNHEQGKITPVANKSATGMSKTGAAQMSGAKNNGSQTPSSVAYDVKEGVKGFFQRFLGWN
ncbi:hypothetical protein [Arsenophonus nasoniae]|uniref:Uncharacterized protein n=1 Tax=Arsenophonus nasoniae TaxID=638 RepID=A0AA95GRE9_9GAMM|nr:hypothetical protein [Arsenophonus nasoniae]WGM03508.1 hypothetical protein QE210_18470 [Arsenophonus nasoniae]